MTRMLRTLIAPALAFAAFASTANADYTFTNLTNTITAPGVTVTPVTSTSTDSTPSNPTLFTFALGAASTPGTYSFGFTESITGTGTLAGVNQMFTVFGTFQVFFASSTAVISTFTPTSLTASNMNYLEPLAAVNYITSASGTTATLTVGVIPTPAAAVPEPASIAMLSMGLLVPAGFAARRRLARA